MSATSNLTTTVQTPELSGAEFAEWAVSEALSALGQADRTIEKLDPDQSFDAWLAAAAARKALMNLQAELAKLITQPVSISEKRVNGRTEDEHWDFEAERHGYGD